jgi:hypothetical protein
MADASSVLTVSEPVPAGKASVASQVAKPFALVASKPFTCTRAMALWSLAVPRTVTCPEASKAVVPGKVIAAVGAVTSSDSLPPQQPERASIRSSIARIPHPAVRNVLRVLLVSLIIIPPITVQCLLRSLPVLERPFRLPSCLLECKSEYFHSLDK